MREANESLENAKGQHEVLTERVKKRIASHGDDKNLPKKEVHRISNISKRAEIAAQRVKVAEAVRLEKEAQLRLAILKSIARDGPGLLSATGGTLLYGAHIPELLSQSQQPKPNPHTHHLVHRSAASQLPGEALLPGKLYRANIPHYLSFSVATTTQLQKQQ